jgi:hypothetical protein
VTLKKILTYMATNPKTTLSKIVSSGETLAKAKIEKNVDDLYKNGLEVFHFITGQLKGLKNVI